MNATIYLPRRFSTASADIKIIRNIGHKHKMLYGAAIEYIAKQLA